MKLKMFCTAKELISEIKRQPTEWEKIFENVTNEGLMPKIYKQLIQLNIKNQKTLMDRRCKQTFLQGRQMANKYIRRCSTLLIIREMQIVTTIVYHFILVRTVIIKESTSRDFLGSPVAKTSSFHSKGQRFDL